MPNPVFHIGTNSFFGLALRRWVDPFVIVAVNVVIDLEVLFSPGFPHTHRHWYFHTFLVGGMIGAVFGVVCWFFRRYISKIMDFARIIYKPKLWKMCLAGTLGACLHILMDALTGFDVQPLRPFSNRNVLWRLFKHTYRDDPVQAKVQLISLILLAAAIILYILAARKFKNQKK